MLKIRKLVRERVVLPELVVAKYLEPLDWTYGLPKLTIYDKSGHGPGITLFNIGREAHTYIHHIVTRYNNLSKVTFFLQGDPMPHMKGTLHECLNKPIYGFTPLGQIWSCDDHGEPHHTGLRVKAAYRSLFNTDSPGLYWFSVGACFAVTREAIRKRPLSFYQTVYRFMLEDEQGPWLMERLWAYIFIHGSHDPMRMYDRLAEN